MINLENNFGLWFQSAFLLANKHPQVMIGLPVLCISRWERRVNSTTTLFKGAILSVLRWHKNPPAIVYTLTGVPDRFLYRAGIDGIRFYQVDIYWFFSCADILSKNFFETQFTAAHWIWILEYKHLSLTTGSRDKLSITPIFLREGLQLLYPPPKAPSESVSATCPVKVAPLFFQELEIWRTWR